MIRILTLVLAVALSAGVSHAQTTASHRAAAETLMDVTNVQELFEAGLRIGLDATVGAEMEALRPTMEAFFDRYVSWDVVQPQYVDLFTEVYSEGELLDLVAFYQTPLGQRVVEKQEYLAQEGSRIGRDLVEAHQAELMAMILDAMGADGVAPPPPAKSNK